MLLSSFTRICIWWFSWCCRLEKRSSIADLRVEYQELERFCIQNRFAKFHSRVQPDPAETSSSNGATLTVPKPLPQRYVTAFPMPMTVPEDAQCFSLWSPMIFTSLLVCPSIYTPAKKTTRNGTQKMECKRRGLLVVEDLRPFDHLDQRPIVVNFEKVYIGVCIFYENARRIMDLPNPLLLARVIISIN